MRAILIAALAGSAGFAQTLVDAGRVAQASRELEVQPGEAKLACEVTPIRPTLNFGFRFQAGYIVRVPMRQYSGAGHGWVVLMRISPLESQQPVYLANRVRLPEVPKTQVQFQIGGGYLVGEGRYRVNLAMFDDQSRVCRKQWEFDAKLTRSESKVKLTIPPETVAQMSGRGLPKGSVAADDSAPFRLTVLMHAAPLAPRRTRMRPNDRLTLIGSLASLLQRVPARNVRLVVFNLDQQKELYRRDNFTLDSLDRVTRAINELEIGLVDYHLLQKPKGHIDLLAGLVNREINAPEPSDAVVFLGPPARFVDRPAQSAVSKPLGGAPRFLYFEYRGPVRAPEPVLMDSISFTVGRLKGKTIQIYTPGNFASAIEQLEKMGGGR